MLKSKFFLATSCLALATTALAEKNITMNFTQENGIGESAGTITISETQYGLLFTPNLRGLTPGAHGFHIHANQSCDKNGMAAGGHFDPLNTGRHLGPYNSSGHYGDLPVLHVNADGTATTPVLAPRIKSDAKMGRHALMIHHAGDNYADTPEKLGGGGARMVCGIIN